MKIKTQLTISLLVSYVIIVVVFVWVVGSLFLKNQRSNLVSFTQELLKQNSKLLEDSSNLFFKLMDEKFFGGLSRADLFEYIKTIDQLSREVVVFDYQGQSLLKGHSRLELETLLSKSIINERLKDLNEKNIKNFSLDNFAAFRKSPQAISPVKVFFQIYNGQGVILGFGQILEDIKTRLIFIERQNRDNQRTFLVVTFLINIIGVTFITAWVLFYSKMKIFKPVEMLLEKFGHVAKGELFHRVEIPVDNEIGILSSAFNDMTENLSQSVNEIHAANIKLDSYSKELENEVELRTKELSAAVVRLKQEIEERKAIEKALEKARVESESANIAKSQFLANMSHEIRTPMNAIIGMAELVLDTGLTNEQHDYILTLKNSSESLLGLLNDILDLSKIEVGKLDVEPIEFHFRKCLHDLTKNLAIQALRKTIELVMDIEPTIPDVVIGDPGRLRQILTNLIGNAIKFTPAGRILVTVKLESQAFPESSESNNKEIEIPSPIIIKFTVSDTGIGIPVEKQKLIFEKFYQTDSSVTRKFGGTGLGLAISLQLAQLMGGHIAVKSPGELQDIIPGLPGSSFSFSLVFKLPRNTQIVVEPVEIKEPKELKDLKERYTLAEPVKSAIQEESIAEGKKQFRVLVAEDNLINQKLIRRMLEKMGISTHCVINGKEAVEKNKEGHFDLILMDIQMPEMDGVEATHIIRQMEKETGVAGVPIIAVTAHAMKGDRERFIAAGMNAYLAKPIKQTEIIALVESFMTGSSSGRRC